MCGRFTLRTPADAIARQLRLLEVPDLEPRYNVAPSQSVAAVRYDPAAQGRELLLLRWGLVPGWAKDPAIGNRMINARSETAATKPSFRSPFRKRRCLIVADGFYEWRKTTGGKKQPMYIHRPDGGVFGFAGLWDRWSGGGEVIESCTILTTNANRRLATIHDRMPVILDEADYDAWLDPDLDDVETLQRLLHPAADELLEADEVSTLVNSPRNEDPRCIEPVQSPST